MELPPKNIILQCGTNDINDNSEAEPIIEDCNSNINVSGIVPRYGKLNNKVRSVNHYLQIYSKNIIIHFIGHENTNPSKYLNRSDQHLSHLGAPIFLTVNFLNTLTLYFRAKVRL